MNDHITLTGIQAKGFHGVYPDERRDGQDFIVDAILQINLDPAAHTDELSLTVNYAEIAQLIEAEIKGEPVDLIETLALRIIEKILGQYELIDSVAVTVHKPFANVGVTIKDISVTLERYR